MKKIFLLFTAIIIVLAFTQTSFLQEGNNNGFERMTFEVSLDKNSYVLLEPVFVKFKFSNQTGIPQIADSPVFIEESKLKVSFKGKTTIFNELSSGVGKPFRFPSAFQPNGFSSSEEIIASAFTGFFFSEPGNYQIQFVLRSSDGSKFIESNVIELQIMHPQGINKGAFDFMKRNKNFFGMSSWNPKGKEEETLLEWFVNNYGQSAYGEVAISNLASLYLSKGDIDKAHREFEKVKDSNHKSIADDAKNSLAKIAKKRVRLEKMNQPNRPQ